MTEIKKPGDAATPPGQINESKKDINIIPQLDDPSLEEILSNEKTNPKNRDSGLKKISGFLAALDPTDAKNYLEICEELEVNPDRHAGKVLKDYVETMQKNKQVSITSSDKEPIVEDR